MTKRGNQIQLMVLCASLNAAPPDQVAMTLGGRKDTGAQGGYASQDLVNAMMRARIAKDIRKHGVRVGADAGVDPILEAIRGKRLIGLGESTHGTSEVDIMRGNLILAAAKREKVALFLEGQWCGVAPINGWIHVEGYDGELPGLMKNLFAVHDTAEFGDFLKAARAFNAKADAGNGIDLYGVDVQVYGKPADNPTPLLRAWLAARGLGLDAELAAASDWIDAYRNATPVTATQRAQARAAISKIYAAVCGVDPSVGGWTGAMVSANNLDRFAELEQISNAGAFVGVQVNTLGDSPSNPVYEGTRDAGMAANIKTLMDHEVRGKAFFWAHNAHTGRTSAMDMDPAGYPGGWANVGSILNIWLGDAYAPIAFETGAGTFRAQLLDAKGKTLPYQTIAAPPLPADALNSIARTVFGGPVFFRTKDISFLNVPRIEMSAGSVHDGTAPLTSESHYVTGFAYFAVVSFPASHATNPMR